MAERVCVGAFAGAFGVRGEVRIKSFTDDPAAIAAYGPLSTEDGLRTFEIGSLREIKGGYAARVSGVKTREEAEALKSTRLYVPRDALPPPEEEEFYYADLIGLTIELADGTPLGRIRAVQDFGAGDVLEYTPTGGGETRYLPFTRENVPVVDITGSRVVAEPPEETDD